MISNEDEIEECIGLGTVGSGYKQRRAKQEELAAPNSWLPGSKAYKVTLLRPL